MSTSSFFTTLAINKKLLSLVTIPAIGLFTFIGTQSSLEEYKIMVNYNGQADLLLSLQIPPDYYPYQFKKTNLYDYLTNVNKYIVTNNRVSSNKKLIKKGLQKRINSLLSNIKEFGPSLWNDDLYDTGIVYRNNQFWNNKKTSLLFLEQFIADDYQDIKDSYSLLPVHKKLIVTNYRAARDPYTIFSKQVFECFKNKACQSNGDNKNQKIYEKFKKYMETYDHETSNSLYRFGRFIDFWNNLVETNKEQLKKLKFFDDLIKEDNKDLFSLNNDEDSILSKKYLNTVFSKEEICILNKWSQGEDGKSCENDGSLPKEGNPSWEMNYKPINPKIQTTHHPALEQQIIPGTAPLSEGSQKDIIVFLYQFAASIENYVKDPLSGFQQEFRNDYRKDKMMNALNNAYQMSQNINTRITHIREYFKEIEVVDNSFDPKNAGNTNTNSKTFTVLTYPPTSFGAGEATIQSMSKFPWLYRDIGLKQPIPSDLNQHSEEDHEDLSHETFSVDDNGWWWKIGSANLDPTNLLKFKNTTDTLLILANEDDWNLLQDKTSGTLSATTSLLKETFKEEIDVNKIQGNEERLKKNKNYPISYNKYHLWNEGLRSPVALNLLFDNLVDIFQKQYDPEFKKDTKNSYEKAMDWGQYWSENFINGTNSGSPKG